MTSYIGSSNRNRKSEFIPRQKTATFYSEDVLETDMREPSNEEQNRTVLMINNYIRLKKDNIDMLFIVK